MGSQARFRDALAVGEFRALWSAEVLSVVGDQLARVALAVLVYRQTSSAGWTALTYALTFVPALLGGVFLSGLADRFPRRELMVGTDLLRTALAGVMIFSGISLPVLMALVFLLAFAGAPFKAAQQALLPQILPGELYEVGLALRTASMQLAQLGGFAGGAAVLTVVGPRTALGLNAGSFLLAAGLVATGVRRRAAARRNRNVDQSGGVAATAKIMWRDRHLRGLVAVSWLVGLSVVPEGLAAPYAANLGVAVSVAGLLMAADPVGSILGAWALTRIPHTTRARLLSPLAIASGLPLIACVLRPDVTTVVLLWVVSGACSTVYLILAQAQFTRRVPDAQRGAATGLASTGVLTSQGLAIMAGGALAEVLSAPGAVALAGATAVILAGLLGASWLRAAPPDNAEQDRLGGREANDATAADELTSPCSLSSSTPPLKSTAAEHGMRGVNPDIIAHPHKSAGQPASLRSWIVWRWEVWTIPGRVVLALVIVEGLAVALTVAMAYQVTITGPDLVRFGCLALLGVLMGEMTRHVERARRRFNDTPHINLTSVWTFPAAFLLPPTLTAALVVVLYQHLFWRSWQRVRGVHAYRLVYTAATVILSIYTAKVICVHLRFTPTDLTQWTHWHSIEVVTLSLLAYATVNACLIAMAITLFERRIDIRRSLGTSRENTLEFGTLGLGALSIVPMVLHIGLMLLIIPAVMVLHRSVLMRQLEEAASTDPKTGLTNATTWTSIATLELQRAAREHRTIGVLMIDLDYFKNVNDTHGHLVGDQVLHAVANTLAGEVRRHDLMGRWGGEEFVVLCPDLTTSGLRQMGERLCQVVRQLHIPVSLPDQLFTIKDLTVSVGAACYPDFGPDLEDLLFAADDALFGAKDNGRDQTSVMTPARPPSQTRD